MLKACPRCKIEKSKDNFHKSCYEKDGFRYVCKQCLKIDRDNHRISKIQKRLNACNGICPTCLVTKDIHDFCYRNVLANNNIFECNNCHVMTVEKNNIKAWKNYQVQQKLKVMQKYGGKCEFCGISNIEFLCIDHVKDDGCIERREMGGSKNIYKYILSIEVDKSRYRCLCHNCNSIKRAKYVRDKANLKNVSNSEARRLKYIKDRESVLEYYGYKCQCCNEETRDALAIDHINGGGKKHHKEIGGNLTGWIVKNNFPEGFRLLCHNCNFSLGQYGYCPHQNISKLY